MPTDQTAQVSRGRLPSHSSPSPSHTAPPPPSELRPSRPYPLSSLLHLSLSSQVLFRVHDSTSSSPLFWAGRPSISGFSAPNLNLAYLEPVPYSRIYNYTSNSHGFAWAEGRYIRHTILDHVLGKEKQTCLPTVNSIDERPDTPEDEKTPWISTSVDLMWCLYEVIRRLVLFEMKAVCIAVIKHPHATSELSKKKGDSSVSSEPDSDRQPSTATGTQEEQEPIRELMIDPYPLLRLSHQRVKDLLLSVGMRENYETAARASQHTSERLFWGRIFTESILYNMKFTLKHTPLTIPAHFYKPSRRNGPSRLDRESNRQDQGGSWTDNLVWDPRVDAFDTAYRKVLERRKAIALVGAKELVSRGYNSATLITSQRVLCEHSRVAK